MYYQGEKMSFEDECDSVDNWTVFRVKDMSQLLVRDNQGRTKGERKLKQFI